MRALGYLLFAPEVHKESLLSFDAQHSDLVTFCQRESHSLIEVFSDPRRNTSTDQPGMKKMFQYLQEQPEEFLVLVPNPSYLGRTVEEAVNTIIALDRLGSRVVCTLEDRPDPIQGLLDILYTTEPGAKHRRSIRKAMEIKALKGEALGKPPYGYRIGKEGKLEEHSEEGKTVRRIFRLYLDGFGIRKISRQLNQDDHPSRGGGNWSIVTVRDILRNRVHTGTYQRFGLVLPRNHPALISAETFRNVQNQMDTRSPRRHKGVIQSFLLSGIAYCAGCGNRMIGVTRRQVWKRKDSTRIRRTYRYYQCQSRTNHGVCQYHTWQAAKLEKIVQQHLIQIIPFEGDVTQETPISSNKLTDTGILQHKHYKRRYMKYLKQAGMGVISLQRLGVLIRQSFDATPHEKESKAHSYVVSNTENQERQNITHMTSEHWDVLDDLSKRVFIDRWIEQIDVGQSDVNIRIRESTVG